MGVMEGGAYADPNRERDASLTGTSAGSVTQNGDLEAAKATSNSREVEPLRSSWTTGAWQHLKQDIDADKVSVNCTAMLSQCWPSNQRLSDRLLRLLFDHATNMQEADALDMCLLPYSAVLAATRLLLSNHWLARWYLLCRSLHLCWFPDVSIRFRS